LLAALASLGVVREGAGVLVVLVLPGSRSGWAGLIRV
jgi:hypothetical protein